MENSTILFLLLASSAVPAIIIFLLPEKSTAFRNSINLFGVILKIFFVIYLIQGIVNGEVFYYSFSFTPEVSFVLKVDHLSLLFATLSSILWLFTTIYAIGYFLNTANLSRFFGFFSLCVTATVGLSIAGNLFTFFIFYEFLTLTTFVLILHTQTVEARKATVVYLAYTIIGGLFFLVGLVALQSFTGDMQFINGGYLKEFETLSPFILQVVFILLLIGVGVKAAIFPFHKWLPSAMAAPAPISALLHAVAVVKAGAFGIIRIVYDVYGVEFTYNLGLLWIVLGVAVVTILYGSIMALRQNDIKKRLAFSTVSQVSYILLGISLFGPLGTIGGLIHLVHQGVMKITLFFCAGAFAKIYEVKKIEQMNGLGKLMPIGAFAFTVGAFGMIGIPLTAGFLSKWYLGMGAYENNLLYILGVLGLSSLLNAAYFLPMVYRVWFLQPSQELVPQAQLKWENALLIIPPFFTAIFTLYLGIFALNDYSALQWVNSLMQMEYLR